MQRQVARAVTTHALVGIEARSEVLPQVAEHHLDLEPAAAEDDGLVSGADPRRRDPARLEHRAAANAHLAVDERRVIEDEAPLAARSAVAFHQLDVFLFEQSLRQLEWVCDGRRRADKGRARTIKLANSFETPDDICDLASEQSAIGVQLVDDDEIQAREQASPPGVVRKQSCVKHVGVRHHDVAALANRCTAARRGVAVIGVGSKLDRQAVLQRAQLRQLVLSQGFGRK